MNNLTITRRLNEVKDGFIEEFGSVYVKDSFETMLYKLLECGNKSNRHSILAQLFEMFDACGIRYSIGEDNEYYKNLIENSEFPQITDLEEKVIKHLYLAYREFPDPAGYMERMVSRLSEDPEWNNNTLRLRILKQFIKYGNYLNDAGFSGETYIRKYVKTHNSLKRATDDDVLTLLDDGVFDVLEAGETTKEQKKPRGIYGLVKLADDLGAGKFRTGGYTRKGLYLLAIVYKMTFYTGAAEKGVALKTKDYERDIEKNLFRDYYSNNLIRFITEATKGDLCDYEINPTGQGINYRNYAEMVYLYYISKDYDPVVKIKLASEMIDRLEKKRDEETENTKKNNLLTAHYAEKFYAENILSKSEMEFESFIGRYYEIRKSTEAAITVSANQRTAEKSIEKISNSLIHILDEQNLTLSDCRYGLWFVDMHCWKEEDFKELCRKIPGADEETFGNFVKLLNSADNYLRTLFHTDEKPCITRTSMIVAYYYYYNARCDKMKKPQRKSFMDVYKDFCRDLNGLLRMSNYQEIDGKNLLDIMVIFSSYMYLY